MKDALIDEIFIPLDEALDDISVIVKETDKSVNPAVLARLTRAVNEVRADLYKLFGDMFEPDDSVYGVDDETPLLDSDDQFWVDDDF